MLKKYNFELIINYHDGTRHSFLFKLFFKKLVLCPIWNLHIKQELIKIKIISVNYFLFSFDALGITQGCIQYKGLHLW